MEITESFKWNELIEDQRGDGGKNKIAEIWKMRKNGRWKFPDV